MIDFSSILRKGMIMIMFFFIVDTYAQQGVGINATGADPDNSAMLDISSALKGLLIPRVALIGTLSASPILSPALSLLVYNTSTTGDVTPGYYYWDGVKWMRLATGNVTNYDSTLCHDKLKLDSIQLCSTTSLNVIGNINIPADSAYKIGGNKILHTRWNNIFAGFNSGNNTGTGRSNVIVGDTSFVANTSGYKNTGIGDSSMSRNTTGYRNCAVGYAALTNNTTGYNNNAFGYKALYHNTTGYYNNGFGYYVMAANTSGYYDNGVGYLTLYNNTTGSYNNAFGLAAMYNNTTGNFDNAFGYESQYYQTTGHNNTSMGMEALHHNSTGSYNAAFGSYSQHSLLGNYNTSIGDSSLTSRESTGSTGSFNTAAGYFALSKLSTGNYNTIIGDSAGYNITTGSKNILIGSGIAAVSATNNSQLNIGNTIRGSLDTGNVYIKNKLITPYIRISTGAGLNKILVSDANGNGTWQSNTSALYIGELYQGGVIFYIDETGQHGLICSMIDISTSSAWSDNVSTLIGTTSQSDWNGQSNTTAIIGQSVVSAANLCHTYTNANYGTGTYSDWYLPSIDELSKLYHAKYEVNKALDSDGNPSTTGLVKTIYWSSSEDSTNNTWAWEMNIGNTGSFDKSSVYYVRAIRTF